MTNRRGAIDLRLRHKMPPAIRASLRRPAGEEDHRVRGLLRSLRRHFDVLERSVADCRDTVDAKHCRRIDATLLAVAPISRDRFELMPKYVQGEPLERRRLGPVDKRQHLLVNGHPLFPTTPETTIMASACASIQSSWISDYLASPRKIPAFTVACAIFTSLTKCSRLFRRCGWRMGLCSGYRAGYAGLSVG